MFTEINSVNINYIDTKKDDGDRREAVVLLHGWGADITLWKNLIELLDTKYRVVAPDMAGFGKSDEPGTAWCVDDYVDLIINFCLKLGIKTAVFLGHSFGGRVIIKLAARENCPVTPSRIILTDSAGIKPKKTAKQKLSAKTYKLGKGIMQTPPMKKLFPDAVENMRNRHGSADYLAASPVMRATLVKTVNEDLTDLLPLIKQSTLLIWGDMDDATPLSDGELMEKLIKDSGLAVIKGSGHYSFIDGWYTYSRIISSFLEIN